MLKQKDQLSLRYNSNQKGQPLTPQERERMLRKFLPTTPSPSTPSTISPDPSPFPSRAPPIRNLIKSQIHTLIYTFIHLFFGLYVRTRIAYHAIVDRILAILYYHHRTPDLIRKDVKNLSRLPEHLSVILSVNTDDDRGAGLEQLVHEVSEISAWCASAGIPALSIYERTGILKNYIPQTHHTITRTLQAYFGNTPYSKCPTVSVRAPNLPTFSPPTTPPTSDAGGTHPDHITILLLSEDDGRNTLVDLTKTLAEMAQRSKISPADISAELIDAEITESVMGEPDILLLFAPRVMLDGYPPWQVRLTEIYHVPDNTEGVGYQVFLRALHRYAHAQMRFGR
ncbi:Undecaprenyl diphosphate synthase [Tothia fuscella]|uniref:ditrans,polycis-polyprenyl diphosphate synthase [(2E,6E)-farnesyldiphosphate specific] n=1 Tax=Tothia fuscella TaxID=1048955 RepID=A0A9P4U445_9PEZI|nr:Undecaprenyl diphosphate synthase [Tothia fuscella]